MGGSGSSSKMARELKGKSRPLAIIRLRLFRVLVNTPICRNYCRIRHVKVLENTAFSRALSFVSIHFFINMIFYRTGALHLKGACPIEKTIQFAGVNCSESYASALSLAKDAAAPAKNIFVIARLHGAHDDLTRAGGCVNKVALSQVNADMIAEIAVVADCVKAH